MTHGEHRVNWRALVFYGLVSVVVVLAGAAVLYSYFERQWLVDSVNPDPLPKITVLTSSPASPLAAAWVAALTEVDLSPTLVPLEQFSSSPGIVAICDLSSITPAAAATIRSRLKEGGGVAILGASSNESLAFLDVKTAPGVSGDVVRVVDDDSPILARVDPGRLFQFRRSKLVTLLEEQPSMFVDARWQGTERAAIAHMNVGPGRVLWLGIDPTALVPRNEQQFAVMLRTSLRWLDGQPISEAAIGTAAAARQLGPASRMAARKAGMSFGVDRLKRAGLFSLRVMNRGTAGIKNPTVKCWLPPNAKSVSLQGSLLLRRGFSLVPVPEESAVMITLPELGGHQERTIKLKVRDGG